MLGIEPPIEDWIKPRRRSTPRCSRSASARRPTRIDGRQVRRSRSRDLDADREERSCSRTLDHHWKEHLATLDALRQVIHLRAYAQKTPINEYKQEAFALFERMLAHDPRGRDPHARHRPVPHGAGARASRAARLPDHARRSADRRRRHARLGRRRAGADHGAAAASSARRSRTHSLGRTRPNGRAWSAATRRARAARAASTSTATAR